MDIEECLRAQQVSEEIIAMWNSPLSEKFLMRSLGAKITALCSACQKKVILMIDEVDKNSDNQIFLSFLGLLREKYLKWQQGKDQTFQSVILAGVYDIKTLKLKLHPQEESKYNSPWNIAVDFLVDMSFSAEQIAAMLDEYEEDYHTGMNINDVAELLYDYTSGYPYLVSRICQLVDERVAEMAVNNKMYMETASNRNQFIVSGMFQMDLETIISKQERETTDVQRLSLTIKGGSLLLNLKSGVETNTICDGKSSCLNIWNTINRTGDIC